MPRLLKEPLVHFLLLGALVIAWFQLVRAPEPSLPPDEIVVTSGQIRRLAALFQKTWQRPPTASEVEALIEDFVREEIYYREAVAMGLDRDDTIIRRRMRQKLEFVTEDVVEQVAPTEADLEAYLREHADAYRADARLSFRHLYFSPDRRADAERDAAAALARLRAGAAAPEEGDSLLMVEPAFDDEPLREVERALGPDFAAALLELPVGEWSGPVRSGVGFHLVLVEKREEGTVPGLAKVREAVARDWEAAQRRELRERFYRELRKKYVVTVERDG